MEAEISNSTMVGAIEDKLPTTIKSMWSLEVSAKDSKIDERCKFPYLLEFLLKHRRAIEYSSNDFKAKKQVKISTSTVINHINQDPKRASSNNEGSSTNNNNGCWYHETSAHDIQDCSVFKNASIDDRWDMIMDYRVCWCCLKPGHRQASCFKSRECGRDGCRARHHQSLHMDAQWSKRETRNSKPIVHNSSDRSPANARGNSDSVISEDKTPPATKDTTTTVGHAMNDGRTMKICLLQIMQVRGGINGETPMNAFWDSGSKVTMITFKKAKELGLRGEKIKINIIKVGADRETIDSKLYEVPIHDRQGNLHYFKAFGISRISTAIESNDISEVSDLFSMNPAEVKRPIGEIDMLIGFEYAGFHPEKREAVDHLLLMENKFGLCLGGSHHLLQEKTQLMVQDVEVSHAIIKLSDFFENESLGVSCKPKCGNCRCGECPIGGKQYTLQQERELAMIEKGLELQDGVWVATYPWKKDPNQLPNNKVAALSMLKSTEKGYRRMLCMLRHTASKLWTWRNVRLPGSSLHMIF